MRPKILLASAAVVAALGTHQAAPVAHAQLFGGMSPEEAKAMIPSQVEVNAGETTTVDVGFPVDANYSADGWSVSSNGTSVTVTAPDNPGATASVPVSAGGQSTTVNLVAVGGGADNSGAAGDSGASGASDGGGQDSSGSDGSGESGGSNGEDAAGDAGGAAGGAQDSSGSDGAEEGAAAAGGAAASVTHPQRSAAAAVDTSGATQLDFDGTIEGNVLTVKVSLGQARDLMKYMGASQEGATLRYVDVNGNVIKGVERHIDKASRTMTLTYPEGETPDNPFIMEVVRDDKAEFIAVIKATNAPLEAATNPDSPYAKFGADPSATGKDGKASQPLESTKDEDSQLGPILLGAAALVLLAGALIALATRRRRNHNGVSSQSTR